MVLVMYAPKVIEAVQQRKVNKQKAQQEPQPQQIDIPIDPRYPRPAFAPKPENTTPIRPVVEPVEVKQPIKKSKGGRPKGSKDTKPRKTDGYKKQAKGVKKT